jgi:hypothetical protein
LLLDPGGEEHAVYMHGLGTIVLLLVPLIPGLRDIPQPIPVHNLVWRSWYRCDPGSAGGGDAPQPERQPDDPL